MYDSIEVVGDDIFFGHWRVGRKPDDMPATVWDDLSYLLERPPTEQIEADLRKAHDEEIEAVCDECDADIARLEERIVELRDELEDAHNDLSGYEAGDSCLMKLKARLRSKMK